MNSRQQRIRRRRSEMLALRGLRWVLAIVLLTLGCGFWFAPRLAEALAHGEFGPGFGLLLGATHLAGGIALLVPRLAARTALVLGLFIAGITVPLVESGQNISTGGPALMAFALLLLGAGSRLRHRADLAAWREMLARYADQQDPRRLREA
jgi:hypothetical protein